MLSLSTYSCLKKYLYVEEENVEIVHGGGSDRNYYRIYDISKVSMRRGEPFLNLKSKSAIAVYSSNIIENKQFINMTKIFHNLNIHVPEIYCELSEDGSFYILEDLGSENVASYSQYLSQSEVQSLYKNIIKGLLNIQSKVMLTTSMQKIIKERFSEKTIWKDYSYFSKFYLKNYSSSQTYHSLIEKIVANLDLNENYFVYRDFQTRNMVLKNDLIYFIDYQSAMFGSRYYDLSAFLFSSSSLINDKDYDYYISYYYHHWNNYFDEKLPSYVVVYKNILSFGILRLIQAIGKFAYLYQEKKKNIFEDRIERSVKKLDFLLSKLEEL